MRKETGLDQKDELDQVLSGERTGQWNRSSMTELQRTHGGMRETKLFSYPFEELISE